MRNFILYASILLWMMSCGKSGQKEKQLKKVSKESTISDDSLLNLVQYQTFQYFWDGAEPNSGMAPERIHMDNIYPKNDEHVVTTGGSGFGLMAIIVGVERGFIKRTEAIKRFERILNFLEKADRFHGVWPHWLNGETGEVVPFSKKDDGGDLVETSFLAAGLLTVRQYLNPEDPHEKKLIDQINILWEGIEFDWYTKRNSDALYWHWSPNYGWEMNFPVQGYNECLIMYVLAAASPLHAIDRTPYEIGWARNGAIKNDTVFMGLETVLDHYAGNDDPIGPLFWAHYSYVGLNPKNLKDQYADYWKLNTNHAKIHYLYCVENPNEHKGYGENCWGLTSSYSPEGYAGHHPGNSDIGVITPTAALSSFPYTPKESMAMLRYMYEERSELIGEYGPYDAFRNSDDWYLPRYLAIDQGPIPVMIENHRSGLIWNLFMSANEVGQGLDKLGFTYD